MEGEDDGLPEGSWLVLGLVLGTSDGDIDTEGAPEGTFEGCEDSLGIADGLADGAWLVEGAWEMEGFILGWADTVVVVGLADTEGISDGDTDTDRADHERDDRWVAGVAPTPADDSGQPIVQGPDFEVACREAHDETAVEFAR